MRKTSGALRTALWLGVALAGAAGCLVVSPLDPLPEASTLTSAGKSTGAETFGGSSGGNTPAGGAAPSAAGEAANAGQSNSDGECESTADCPQPTANKPYFCRPADHKCIALTSDACPFYYGAATDPNAIYFGAFATLNAATPEENSVLWSHRLALDELSGDDVRGLPPGPNGMRRPLVMIACNNANGLEEQALAHLVNDVQVPAVIANLKPGELGGLFAKYAKQDVFYLSPVSVTNTVAQYDDHGLIWALLGQPSDLAPTYGELLKLAEKRLRKDRKLLDVDSIKVALVTTQAAFDSDLANAVEPILRFNGDKDPQANGANYLSFKLDPTDPQLAQALPQVADDIIAFGADIVISAASELFTMDHGLLQTIEGNWDDADKPRPFYILSPYNAGNLGPVIQLLNDKITYTDESDPELRFVGVTVAGPRDTTLQNSYATHLHASFKKAYFDTANYYDSVYYLAYAMLGAGTDTKLTGSGIAKGMQRLLSGENYAIGSASIDPVFKVLSKPGSTVHVASTLGPPDFDAMTGVRPVEGGVLCFQKVDLTVVLHTDDVLRYDRDAGALTGKFPCFSGFYP
jgi:hypothetical protein